MIFSSLIFTCCMQPCYPIIFPFCPFYTNCSINCICQAQLFNHLTQNIVRKMIKQIVCNLWASVSSASWASVQVFKPTDPKLAVLYQVRV